MRKEENKGFRLIGHCDFGGSPRGDIAQLLPKDNFLICGHPGRSDAGVSVVDVSNPRKPRVVNQLPAAKNTHSNKVQIAGDILVVNNERFPFSKPAELFKAGIDMYDISRLPELRPLAYFKTGGEGVHRFWFADGRYAYLTAGDDGYIDQILKIIDLKDPAHPKEVGRWALPGMKKGEKRGWHQYERGHADKNPDGTYKRPPDAPAGMEVKKASLHLPIVAGDRAYCAWWDSGLVILDVSDVSNPKLVSHTDLKESMQTHTALPLRDRNLCIVSDEYTSYAGIDSEKKIRVFDLSDERHPKVISELPQPQGDYVERGGRSGPHNAHENRPGSFISSERVYWTFFNAGLRVYDIRDAYHPKEIAHYVPATPKREPIHVGGNVEVLQVQVDDVYVAESGLVYLSERMGDGVYILEPEF
ncbi:MAG: hypothetical protein AABZ64_00245 [Nitrospinota bacterium]